MDQLPIDILVHHIITYLSNKEICYFLSTSKKYYSLLDKIYFNDPIILNKNIRKLKYFDRFTNVTDVITFRKRFPKNIKKLSLDYKYDYPIKKDSIPITVTHLTFAWYYDQPIDGIIPSNVTHLTFGFAFNQPIVGAIPNSVTHLTFGCCFNQPIIGAIPNGVKYLKFGDCFNQPIIGAIPSSVIHLKFGSIFNQPINGAIPSNVKYLTLGDYFYQDIDDYIFTNLQKLTFNQIFSTPQVLNISKNMYDYLYANKQSFIDKICFEKKMIYFQKNNP